MHVTFKRYEGIDRNRTDEVVKKVGESLVPRLSELPGFSGYYLIEAGEGVMSSIGFFDTSAHADESTRIADLDPRGEAGERTSQPSEGHGRRGARAADERPRPGVAPRPPQEREGPHGGPSRRPEPRRFPAAISETSTRRRPSWPSSSIERASARAGARGETRAGLSNRVTRRPTGRAVDGDPATVLPSRGRRALPAGGRRARPRNHAEDRVGRGRRAHLGGSAGAGRAGSRARTGA